MSKPPNLITGTRVRVRGRWEAGGRRIEFGAQVTDFITIKLTGVATRIGNRTVAPMDGCVQPPGSPLRRRCHRSRRSRPSGR